MIAHACDYHLHTPLCHHAVGWPIDYARRAVELGMTEIGFSDHSPMSEQFDDWRMALDDLPRYLESVAEARAAFPELTIRLGLEVDYLPGHEPWIEKLATMAPWDYFIGSVHYIAPGWDVDNPRWIGRFRDRPVEEVWELYGAAYVQCIRSGLFDFVAHPDLVKKFGFRPEGDLRRFYEPIVAALAEKKTPFEINTAGLRKDCRELYPAQDFLSLAQSAGIPLTINSDSHDPAELAAGFTEGVQAARAAGYTHTLRFAARQSSPAPLPAVIA